MDLDLEYFFNSKKHWTFTLEAGHGETYSHGLPTLYAHSIYEHSSVLAGRPQRVFVTQWQTWEEAQAAVEKAKATYKGRFDFEFSGTTHIPISQLVSHLPDDTDY